jgi:ribosome-binding protein aMBF1 (putative translation factor)
MIEMADWKQLRAERAAEPGFEAAYRNARLALALGKAVRELREKTGITQTELARRIGSTQPVIARLEAGGVDPRLSTVQRVFEELGGEFTIGAGSVRVA